MKAFVTGGSGFVGRNLVAALVARGDEVRALARSKTAAEAVRAIGAEPVIGDLHDVAALRQGMAGCDAVFHGAAHVIDWGDPREFDWINVEGTQRVLEAARAAAVPVSVLVSTEAVLIDGSHLIDVDETRPYPERPAGDYPRSKAAAERLWLSANAPGFRTVAIRPAVVWGKGDTSVLTKVAEVVRKGRFWWPAGSYRRSTSHVANVVEGLLLAAEKGHGGEAYFVTDGEAEDFKPFLRAMLRSVDADPGTRALPRPLIKALAALTEWTWILFRLPGIPPLRRPGFHIIGEPVILSDAKARRELGYTGHMTRERGLAEMGA